MQFYSTGNKKYVKKTGLSLSAVYLKDFLLYTNSTGIWTHISQAKTEMQSSSFSSYNESTMYQRSQIDMRTLYDQQL